MNFKNELIRRSPSLLLGGGIAGFIGAVIMSAKATPAAHEESLNIDYEENYLHIPVSRKEKIRRILPYYIPTIGMVMLSTGMVLSSNRIMRNRYTSLLALYTLTNKALGEWENATASSVTKKKLEQIRDKVFEPDALPEWNEKNADTTAFWDPYGGRYIYAKSPEHVRRVIAELNAQLLRDDFVPLNDFYYSLGAPPLQFGGDIGWDVEQREEIGVKFDSVLKEDRAYVKFLFTVEPRLPW